MSAADNYVDDLFDSYFDGGFKSAAVKYPPKIGTFAITKTTVGPTTKYITTSQTTQNTEIKMEKLYEVNGKNRYGVFMAENSRGEAILEMKDTGQYEAFAYSAISKVMPYTFDVMFNGKGTVYSYKGTAGSVAVGDLLLVKGDAGLSVVEVVAVDTKSEKATKNFVGYKLHTSPLN
jgi:hypothetical protein